MTKRLIKTGPHWALAEQLLGEWLGDRDEVGLGDAMSGLDRAATDVARSSASVRAPGALEAAEFIFGCVGGKAGADAVSRLLRARGFRKAGMMGSGPGTTSLHNGRHPSDPRHPSCRQGAR